MNLPADLLLCQGGEHMQDIKALDLAVTEMALKGPDLSFVELEVAATPDVGDFLASVGAGAGVSALVIGAITIT
ncbi:hypothetical protein ACIA8G_09015 [Lentzea sp. NPDC051213]|uniref:hypothetical protein n=1 Tax=Lentzea sp. NPDC051213 TaxID=3364126 RepID=UPI0037BB2F77